MTLLTKATMQNEQRNVLDRDNDVSLTPAVITRRLRRATTCSAAGQRTMATVAMTTYVIERVEVSAADRDCVVKLNPEHSPHLIRATRSPFHSSEPFRVRRPQSSRRLRRRYSLDNIHGVVNVVHCLLLNGS